MALEEQGQQSIWEFIKKMLKKGLSVLTNTAKEKSDKAIENHQLSSIEKLAKKNPNMGIHEEIQLTQEIADEVGKELKKMHQDFVKEKYFDKDKGQDCWKISVTAGNKTLVGNLINRAKDKLDEQDQKKSKGKTIDEKLEEAKAKANERNKQMQREMPTPEKHKENDGMSL